MLKSTHTTFFFLLLLNNIVVLLERWVSLPAICCVYYTHHHGGMCIHNTQHKEKKKKDKEKRVMYNKSDSIRILVWFSHTRKKKKNNIPIHTEKCLYGLALRKQQITILSLSTDPLLYPSRPATHIRRRNFTFYHKIDFKRIVNTIYFFNNDDESLG